MKKTFLSIVVVISILVLSLAFVSCNNSSATLQSSISEMGLWLERILPETFEYDMMVAQTDEKIGKLTTKVENMAKDVAYYVYEDGITKTQSSEKTALYTFKATKPNAYIISNELILDDGSYSQVSYTCVYNNLQFFGSYVKTVENDTTTVVVKQNEDGKKCYFKKLVNGEIVKEDNMKSDTYTSSAYYENCMLYFALRVVTTSFNGFTFKTYDIDKKEKIQVSTTCAASEEKYVYNEVEYEYRKVSATTSNDLTGKSAAVSCYVVNDSQTINGYSNVVLAIFEGDYKYILK